MPSSNRIFSNIFLSEGVKKYWDKNKIWVDIGNSTFKKNTYINKKTILTSYDNSLRKLDLNNIKNSSEHTFLDCLDMKLSDKCVDFLTSNMVLEHVPYPQKAFSEAYRVLKNGGIFICVTVFYFVIHRDHEDYFRYTPLALRALANDAGFDILTTGDSGEKKKIGKRGKIFNSPEGVGIICKKV